MPQVGNGQLCAFNGATIVGLAVLHSDFAWLGSPSQSTVMFYHAYV